jgi:hypothetical protein
MQTLIKQRIISVIRVTANNAYFFVFLQELGSRSAPQILGFPNPSPSDFHTETKEFPALHPTLYSGFLHPHLLLYPNV